MSLDIFSLSLDDLSPYARAGLNLNCIRHCDKLIEKYPKIKITFFVPAAYCRLGEQNPAYLTKNPDWVKAIKDLSSNNFSLGLHGYYHRRTSKKYPKSNNDEWEFLDVNEATTLSKKMLDEWAAAGLTYAKIFRPPGFKISVAATQHLTKLGFVMAGHQRYYPNLKKKVVGLNWAKANWDIGLSATTAPAGPVLAYGHTSEWTKNCIGDKTLNNIFALLDKRPFEFRFLQDCVGV